MKEYFFEEVVKTKRFAKPRDRGITVLSDRGLSYMEQQNLLSIGEPFIDYSKIASGISAVLDTETLVRKIELYSEHNITTLPGGLFFEYSVLHQKIDEYMQACVKAGFHCIEVSDTLLEIDLDLKSKFIKKAREEYGFRVLAEVGKKEHFNRKHDLIEDTLCCLSMGAEKVIIEASELFFSGIDEKRLEQLFLKCGTEKLIFELPGPWMEGITLSDVYKIVRWLIRRFGPDVNVANVLPENILKFETVRLGIELRSF